MRLSYGGRRVALGHEAADPRHHVSVANLVQWHALPGRQHLVSNDAAVPVVGRPPQLTLTSQPPLSPHAKSDLAQGGVEPLTPSLRRLDRGQPALSVEPATEVPSVLPLSRVAVACTPTAVRSLGDVAHVVTPHRGGIGRSGAWPPPRLIVRSPPRPSRAPAASLRDSLRSPLTAGPATRGAAGYRGRPRGVVGRVGHATHEAWSASQAWTALGSYRRCRPTR